jgi:hypothetical protein
MFYGFLADCLVLIHLGFVLFVVLGGLLVLRRPRLAWLHLPAAAWGAWIELSGWICPLTPLENHLRHLAGEAGYRDGFIEHYLLRLLYPEGLTRQDQLVLAGIVAAINLAAYAVLLLRHRRTPGGRRP